MVRQEYMIYIRVIFSLRLNTSVCTLSVLLPPLMAPYKARGECNNNSSNSRGS